MIFDGVFGDKIPNKTRQQLIYIRENDFNSLSVSKELHQLCDKYGDEVVKALAPNVYCNTALDVERRERQCKLWFGRSSLHYCIPVLCTSLVIGQQQ